MHFVLTGSSSRQFRACDLDLGSIARYILILQPGLETIGKICSDIVLVRYSLFFFSPTISSIYPPSPMYASASNLNAFLSQRIGQEVFDLAFIMDADGVLLELVHRKATLDIHMPQAW